MGEKSKKTGRRAALRAAGAVAAVCAALLVGLSAGRGSAVYAAEFPIFGGNTRVVTIRSCHEKKGDITYRIDVPAIKNGGSAFIKSVNAGIQKQADAKIEEGKREVAEFKKAFLDTGGTQEQWEERENEVYVNYDVKHQSDNILSFVIDSYISTASAYQEQFFYNLDLERERELTLSDLLGEGWVKAANAAVKEYIAESEKENPGVFFTTGSWKFKTVDENTGFYINEAGNPVLVFPRGTIAIGARGVVEIEVPK